MNLKGALLIRKEKIKLQGDGNKHSVDIGGMQLFLKHTRWFFSDDKQKIWSSTVKVSGRFSREDGCKITYIEQVKLCIR